jgi:hypothetical protein
MSQRLLCTALSCTSHAGFCIGAPVGRGESSGRVDDGASAPVVVIGT